MTNALAEQLVQNYYQTFVAKDLNGFLALLTEDVIHEINQGPIEKGKALFKTFMEKHFSHGDQAVDDLIILSSPDGKYATSRFNCSGNYTHSEEGFPPASGQFWKIPVVSYFEIRDQKISHVAVYYNLKDWIAQVS